MTAKPELEQNTITHNHITVWAENTKTKYAVLGTSTSRVSDSTKSDPWDVVTIRVGVPFIALRNYEGAYQIFRVRWTRAADLCGNYYAICKATSKALQSQDRSSSHAPSEVYAWMLDTDEEGHEYKSFSVSSLGWPVDPRDEMSDDNEDVSRDEDRNGQPSQAGTAKQIATVRLKIYRITRARITQASLHTMTSNRGWKHSVEMIRLLGGDIEVGRVPLVEFVVVFERWGRCWRGGWKSGDGDGLKLGRSMSASSVGAYVTRSKAMAGGTKRNWVDLIGVDQEDDEEDENDDDYTNSDGDADIWFSLKTKEKNKQSVQSQTRSNKRPRTANAPNASASPVCTAHYASTNPCPVPSRPEDITRPTNKPVPCTACPSPICSSHSSSGSNTLVQPLSLQLSQSDPDSFKCLHNLVRHQRLLGERVTELIKSKTKQNEKLERFLEGLEK